METIKDLIDFIGIKIHRQGIDKYNLTEYWVCCPLHKDATPSFRFNDYTWKCWGCNKSGKLYNLYAFYYDVSIEEAKQKCGDIKAPRIHKQIESDTSFKIFDLDNALSQYPIAHNTITYKYIDSSIVDKYKIREINSLYFKSHITGKSYHIKDRIAFPIYRNGILQAVTSRVHFDDIENKCKYMFTPFSEQKGNCLYGIDNIKEGEDLYIVEGPMDVLAMAAQNKNSIALLCCDVSDKQFSSILDLNHMYHIPIVHFLFDGDEAGRLAAIKTQNMLESNPLELRYTVSTCDEGEDPYTQYVLNIMGEKCNT